MGSIELARIDGLTSYWKPVAGEVNLPEAPGLCLRAAAAPGETLCWEGLSAAREEGGYSMGILDFGESDERQVVLRRIEGELESRETLLARRVLCAPKALEVGRIRVEPVREEIAHELGYRAGAELVTTSIDRYRTCTGQLLDFSAACVPEALTDLVEWRIDGHLLYGETIQYSFSRPGLHRVYAGSPDAPRVVELEAYETSIVVPAKCRDLIRSTGGTVALDLEASTLPSGFEGELSWEVETRWGTANFEITGPGTAILQLSEVVGTFPPDSPSWSLFLSCGGGWRILQGKEGGG